MNFKFLINYFAAILSSSLVLCGCSDLTVNGTNGKIFDNALNNGISLGGVAYSYSDANLYRIGEADLTDEINSLKIDWISGQVNIEYHDEDSILIRESSDTSLAESQQLRYLVDNGNLTVRFCQSGVLPSGLNKTLTLTLPKGSKYSAFDADVVSAELYFDSLETGSFHFDSTSGRLSCNTLLVENDADINVVSGKVEVKKQLSATTFDFDSTSGDLALGNIHCPGGIEIDTVSGSAKLDYSEFSDLEFDSTSGNLLITAPKDSSFVADMDSVSGDFDCGIPVVKQNSKLVAGDGLHKLEVNTVSGNCKISAK